MTPTFEPTEEMWGGLARDIMMAFEMGQKTPASLREHLRRVGRTVPDWLADELGRQYRDGVLSKGTRCVLIYKAMLAAEPAKAPAWQPMATAPRDGTTILIRFGSDGVSQATYIPGAEFPWRFIDQNGSQWFVNSAREDVPSHWAEIPAYVSRGTAA